MSSRFFAVFLLAFLVCTGQGERASITKSDDALDTEEDLSSAKSCPKLLATIRRLCDYIPSKVHKVYTKGISGWWEKKRIIVLGRKTNLLAASFTAFEEKKCEGDLTTAKEHLASTITTIKKMASDGGELTAPLARAMSEAEAELAKPEGERDHGSMQAAFMRTVLGGDGDMTDAEKNELLCKEGVCKTDKIIEDVLSKPDSDNLSANETESLKLHEQHSALIDMSTAEDVAARDNIFVSSLRHLSKFVNGIVIGVFGLVWWLVTRVFLLTATTLSLSGSLVASVICGMWWLLDNFVSFVGGSLGWLYYDEFCHETIWEKPMEPVFDNVDGGLQAMEDSNPWIVLKDWA